VKYNIKEQNGSLTLFIALNASIFGEKKA